MDNVDQFIRLGADARLVSAVLQKQSGCINGTIRGNPVRVVFKGGKVSSIMIIPINKTGQSTTKI